MKFSSSLVAFVATAGVAKAAPLAAKRQDYSTSDVEILQYALTLEHLEDKFYRDGLANYTAAQFEEAGFDAAFYSNLQIVSGDETIHVNFLTGALQQAGEAPVAECTYSFPSTDAKSFVALASVLEGVGVSAYVGAAAFIINPEYLTAAASILSVESRHSAYFRSTLGQVPFPQPFDTPLTMSQVFSLAAPFIVECPETNAPLSVKAFPTLTLDPSQAQPIRAGDAITLLTEDYVLLPADDNEKILRAAFVTGFTQVQAEITAVEGGYTLQVPENVQGQTYVVFTACDEDEFVVSDDTVVAGPVVIEITA